jgi:hypothetical protein
MRSRCETGSVGERRCPAQIGQGVKGVLAAAEQQQRLRPREPAEQLEPRIGRRGRAVLERTRAASFLKLVNAFGKAFCNGL